MSESPPRSDADWMRRALEEARLGAERDEVPVGAVLVAPDGTAFVDHNRTREAADPTAHAEIRVIRAAAGRLGDWRLLDHTLYVTLEPCAMCAGAIVLARIPRVLFAATDPKAGMCGSLGNLVQDPRLNHRVELESGLLQEEAASMLKAFFAARRTPSDPGDGPAGES